MVGSLRWAFGGCCTALLVSSGFLPYIEWLDTFCWGVPVIIGVFRELLRFYDANGELHGRWHGTSSCENERTIALWTNALRGYEEKASELIPPGPRSRESVQAVAHIGNPSVSQAMLPMCYVSGRPDPSSWCRLAGQIDPGRI